MTETIGPQPAPPEELTIYGMAPIASVLRAFWGDQITAEEFTLENGAAYGASYTCLTAGDERGAIQGPPHYVDRPSFMLTREGTFENCPVGTFRPQLGAWTDAELEEHIWRLLDEHVLHVRPEELWDYYSPQEVGYPTRYLIRDGKMWTFPDSDFFGVVLRYENLSGFFIWNLRAAVCVDAEAARLPHRPNYTRAVRKARHRSDRTALALLHRHLTKEQRWELRAFQRFSTHGQDGRMYRVYARGSSNVRLVENGKETLEFCVVPMEERLPVFDCMLISKIMLQTDIEEFMKLAKTRPVEEVS